jgi:hypothetical protein
MSLIWVAIGIDYRDLDAVHEADRIDMQFAVVEAVIGPLHGRSVEDPPCILESDTMPANVRGVLGRIPREPHPAFLENVFTAVEM